MTVGAVEIGELLCDCRRLPALGHGERFVGVGFSVATSVPRDPSVRHFVVVVLKPRRRWTARSLYASVLNLSSSLSPLYTEKGIILRDDDKNQTFKRHLTRERGHAFRSFFYVHFILLFVSACYLLYRSSAI